MTAASQSRISKPSCSIALFRRDQKIHARLYLEPNHDNYIQGIGDSDAEAIGKLVCNANHLYFEFQFSIIEDPET